MFIITLHNGPLHGKTVSTEDRHDEIRVTMKASDATLSGVYRVDSNMNTARWAGWDQDDRVPFPPHTKLTLVNLDSSPA